MATSLLNGVAFVTGAGAGIGQATAYSLARHGATALAITDIDINNLHTTAQELRSRHPRLQVLDFQMDVSNESSVVSGIAKVIETLGRIDIAVNNAGIGGSVAGSADISIDDWQKLMGVNLTGVFLCQRSEIRQMLKQEPLQGGARHGRGVIVNVASMLGVIATAPTMPNTAYVSAKHAVIGLTKSDAAAYADKGIRINAICPGYVGTPLLKSIMPSSVMEEEIEKTPMKRMAQMDEIADSIVYLASPMASFTTGIGLVVDGGFVLS